MATRTISNAGGIWANNSTWVEGVAPTAADDVVATATSGDLSALSSGTNLCRSADFTNYVGTFTMGTSAVLSVGTSTPGPGNVALKFVAGMAFVGTSTTTIAFVSTSATQQAITCAGKTTNNTNHLTFSGVGGSWIFAGGIGCNLMQLNSGTVNLNGQTMTANNLNSSGSLARTLTLGAAAITLNGSSGWNTSVTTNMTFSGALATITITGTAAVPDFGNLTYGTVVMTGGSGGQTASGSATFANLSFIGTAVSNAQVLLGSNITVTTKFTATGNHPLGNRMRIGSNVFGTARTLTVNGSVDISNADFSDIIAAGAGWATMVQAPLVNAASNPSFESATSPWLRFSVAGTGGTGPTSVTDAACVYGTKAGEITLTSGSVPGTMSLYLGPSTGAIPLNRVGERIGIRVRAQTDNVTAGSFTQLRVYARLTDAAGQYVASYSPSTLATTGAQSSPVTDTFYDLYGYIDTSVALAAYPTAVAANIEMTAAFTAGTLGGMRLDSALLYRFNDNASTTVSPHFDTTLGSFNLISNPKLGTVSTDWDTSVPTEIKVRSSRIHDPRGITGTGWGFYSGGSGVITYNVADGPGGTTGLTTCAEVVTTPTSAQIFFGGQGTDPSSGTVAPSALVNNGWDAVVAGQTYSYSVWLKVSSGAAVGTLKALMYFRDVNGLFVSSLNATSNIVQVVNPTTGTWYQVTGTVTVPATATYAMAWPILQGAGVIGVALTLRATGQITAATPTIPIFFDGDSTGYNWEPVTNYCLNPGIETNANNWGAIGASTITREVAAPATGVARLKVVTTGAGANEGVSTTTATTVAPATGKPVHARIRVLGDVGGEALRAYVRVTDVATGTVSQATYDFSATTSWVDYPLTIAACGPSGYQTAIFVRTQGTTACTFYVDCAMIDLSENPHAYFDGSTAGCTWTGTGNNSTSVVTAPARGAYGTSVASIGRTLVPDGSGDYGWHLAYVKDNTATGRLIQVGLARQACIPNVTYTASADYYITKGSASTNAIRMQLAWYDSGGTFISTAGTALTEVVGTRTRYSTTGVAPSNAVFVQAAPAMSPSAALDVVDFWATRVLIEASSVARPYYDGATAGYAWVGTTDLSQTIYAGRSVGDMQNTTGIPGLDASRTLYARAAASWTLGSTWALTSGGSAITTIPLAQDDVVIDANTPVGNVTLNARQACRNLTITNWAGSFSSGYGDSSLFGNFTVTNSPSCTLAGTNRLNLAGRGARTFTSGGRPIAFALQAANIGTYKQMDDITTAGAFTQVRGTWDCNGKNMTATAFQASGTETKAMLVTGTTFTATGTGNVWFFALSSATFTGICTINIATASATAQGTAGFPATADIVVSPGAGTLTMPTGTATWRSLTVTGPKTVIIPAGSTKTIGRLELRAVPATPIVFTSDTPGSVANIAISGPATPAWAVNVKDVSITPGNKIDYGGVDNGNNSGWGFVPYISAIQTTVTLQAYNVKAELTSSNGKSAILAVRRTTQLLVAPRRQSVAVTQTRSTTKVNI